MASIRLPNYGGEVMRQQSVGRQRIDAPIEAFGGGGNARALQQVGQGLASVGQGMQSIGQKQDLERKKQDRLTMQTSRFMATKDLQDLANNKTKTQGVEAIGIGRQFDEEAQKVLDAYLKDVPPENREEFIRGIQGQILGMRGRVQSHETSATNKAIKDTSIAAETQIVKDIDFDVHPNIIVGRTVNEWVNDYASDMADKVAPLADNEGWSDEKRKLVGEQQRKVAAKRIADIVTTSWRDRGYTPEQAIEVLQGLKDHLDVSKPIRKITMDNGVDLAVESVVPQTPESIDASYTPQGRLQQQQDIDDFIQANYKDLPEEDRAIMRKKAQDRQLMVNQQQDRDFKIAMYDYLEDPTRPVEDIPQFAAMTDGVKKRLKAIHSQAIQARDLPMVYKVAPRLIQSLPNEGLTADMVMVAENTLRQLPAGPVKNLLTQQLRDKLTPDKPTWYDERDTIMSTVDRALGITGTTLQSNSLRNDKDKFFKALRFRAKIQNDLDLIFQANADSPDKQMAQVKGLMDRLKLGAGALNQEAMDSYIGLTLQQRSDLQKEKAAQEKPILDSAKPKTNK